MYNALENLYHNNLILDEKDNPFILNKGKEKEGKNK
jgi:hypothetical protein